jgi:transcriptional antiterminator RfaH
VNNAPQSVDLWRETNWFAIHAKTGRETFAAANISAFGIRILLPLVKVEPPECAAPRAARRPLFPGYLFAKFCPEISCELVKNSRGVLRIVSSGRFPLPVRGTVIQEILDRIEQDGLIRLRPQSLESGTRVLIQEGPFEGLMGRVERELSGGKRVAILLETVMQARVLIERQCLETAA